MININDNCANLVKLYEGCKLNAYHDKIDPPDVDTVGYGTIQYPPTYLSGKKVKVGDPAITQEQALDFLKWEISQQAQFVDPLLRDDLTVNQFDAVISFAYNEGVGKFKTSTLRAKINANPNDPSIRDEFMKWVYADGQVQGGLIKRRKAEADLYFTK